MSSAKQSLAAIYRNDLLSFAWRAFAEIEPGTDLKTRWHHEVVAYHLSLALRGEIKRLIINQPPKTLKTYMVAVAFVAFLLGKNPRAKLLIVSYDEELATRQARQVRMILRSKWFRELFPATKISAGKDSESYFETTQGGEIRAVAVTGGITGYGYDFIVMDDVMKADAARSEINRRRVEQVFASTIINRWRDPGKGVLIVVMQRLHVGDFTAYLLRTLIDVEHICIPAIGRTLSCYPLSDELEYEMVEGELLEPGRLTKEFLGDMRATQGKAYFEAQYQQDPQLTGGHIIDPNWLRLFDTPREPDLTVISIDPAFTESGGNYSACLVCGLVKEEVELLYGERVQMEFPRLRRWIMALDKRFRPEAIVVEGIGSGRALVQQLRHDVMRHLYSIDSHRLSKVQRMEVVSPMIEQGRVSVPEGAPFVDSFLRTLAQFPYGADDDWPDCLSQLLLDLDEIRRRAQRTWRELNPPPEPPESFVRPWSPYYRKVWI